MHRDEGGTGPLRGPAAGDVQWVSVGGPSMVAFTVWTDGASGQLVCTLCV